MLGLFRKFRKVVCAHEFKLKDLDTTNIPEPERPSGFMVSSKELMAWHQSLYTHDSHTKRVRWPCHKCGKVFSAHCGLDISPKHGPIVKN